MYHSDRNSSKYKSDCYELENGFYETEVFACVDTCNPETAKSHHMLRCDYNCEGKWNTSMWCFSFCHFERCWYFLLLVTEIKLGKFRKSFLFFCSKVWQFHKVSALQQSLSAYCFYNVIALIGHLGCAYLNFKIILFQVYGHLITDIKILPGDWLVL